MNSGKLELGQIWTPLWVADAMANYVANSPLVLDPAVGTGIFDLAVRKYNPNIKFVGYDVDKNVLNGGMHSKKSNIIFEDFMLTEREIYPGVIANPPYIRHHKLSLNYKDKLAAISSKILGFKIDRRAGLHVYFFIKCLDMLDKKGRLSFILPADVFEGKFAKELWDWISPRFNIEYLVEFSKYATPFPTADVNAIVIMLKKERPAKEFVFIKVIKTNHTELSDCISGQLLNTPTIYCERRNQAAAIKLGLSREHRELGNYTELQKLAKIVRGIATGKNEFFFLTRKQIEEYGLPIKYFKRAIGRIRDVGKNQIITDGLLEELNAKGRPTYLLYLNKQPIKNNTLLEYLRHGDDLGVSKKPLIKTRNPWYNMEQRKPPPIIFSYLGRSCNRFILNEAGILPLTAFLCVYPKNGINPRLLHNVLNKKEVISNLALVGKTYGGNSIKVEPRQLDKLPIPDLLLQDMSLF